MAKEALILVAAAIGLVATLYFAVGILVNLMLPLISFEREQRWFGGLNLSAQHAPENLENDARLHRAALVLDRLIGMPDTPPLQFSLVLLPDRDPNAFALPGGTIAVTSGLLDLLDEDVALAFVLGHELGHFAHRDHLRGLGRRVGHTLVWTILFGNTGADLAGEHLTRLLDLRYSRGQEERADSYGLRLVFESYGTVEGTDRLFAWLEANRNLPEWAALLTTHPDPGDRIENLRKAAEQFLSGDPKIDPQSK
jgi:Zn-dependent protease with chaperone function